MINHIRTAMRGVQHALIMHDLSHVVNHIWLFRIWLVDRMITCDYSVYDSPKYNHMSLPHMISHISIFYYMWLVIYDSSHVMNHIWNHIWFIICDEAYVIEPNNHMCVSGIAVYDKHIFLSVCDRIRNHMWRYIVTCHYLGFFRIWLFYRIWLTTCHYVRIW